MDPLTILTLTIGNAIAKAIVVGWLKDSPISGQIAADLLDLLRDTIKSQAERERTAEHIEAIGRQIADRMRPHFDQEVAAHPHLNYEAVVWEVATTLQQARINVDLILQYRVDPQKLAEHLIASRRELLKTLSDDEVHLYRQMLTLASQEIINTADELTGFVPAAFAASLHAQDRIFKVVAALLARPSEEMERFEASYRRAAASTLDKVDIFGIRYADQLTQSQSLSAAYITLQAELRRRDPAESESDLELWRTEGGSTRELYSKAQTVTQSIERAIVRAPRLVLRGDAGSGKTTLLKWIAVRAACQDFPAHLASWNKLVPFFIRLRERVNKVFPPPEEFPGLVAPIVTGSMPRGCVHDLLDNGRALVLIDGVDELPRQQREPMLVALDQLVTTYPLARYIITSRPSALKAVEWPEWEQWTLKKRFTTATLQPMRPPEIENLVEQWHKALGQATGAPAKEMDELATNLKRIIRQRRPLGRLATSPLLCAMLCALHHERGGHNLPAERIKLYSDCIEMLLERRDEARRIPLGMDYPDLGYNEKLDLIRHFAYWMMRNDYAEVDVAQADNCFARYLAKTVRAGLKGDQVRRFFVDRANLLREPAEGRIDFTHRTIQEFLTAQAIFDLNDFRSLLGKALNDQWRETIILTSGYAGTQRKADRTQFLKELIVQGDKLEEEHYRHQVHLLAVACLEGNAGLEKDAQEYVLQQAAAIFPPRDEDEAKLVVSAGDPAIPLLAADPKHTEREAAMCVRALALIGSQAALATLVGYTDDSRRQVLVELGRAWEDFEYWVYLRQVLTRCRALHLSNNPSLIGLAQLSQLESLAITDSDQFSDLSPLASLIDLTELSICRSQVSDLNPLTQLSRLTSLDISQTQVSDLRPLAQLAQLATLHASGTRIGNRSLAQLPRLTNLDISQTKISDLRLLAQPAQLTTLDISRTQVRDLRSLTQLSRLTSLDVHQTQVSDLRPLPQLAQLTDLLIGETEVSDLSPLAQLSQLTKLDIRGTWVVDLSALAHLSQLTALSIRGTRVKDLSPLAQLSQLTTLDIRGTQVGDLSPLAQLSRLTSLNIAMTRVSDLRPLAKLPQLTELDISGTPVSRVSPTEGFKYLRATQR
jgi:Leucine-rich repeat (LRR) protein